MDTKQYDYRCAIQNTQTGLTEMSVCDITFREATIFRVISPKTLQDGVIWENNRNQWDLKAKILKSKQVVLEIRGIKNVYNMDYK
jgi:hypothetical protein